MLNGRLRIMLAHHRGPYKTSFVIAVLILLALFVFFPPFEFKPYKIKAQEVITVVDTPPIIEIPPPPKEPAPPIPVPDPYNQEDPDIGETVIDDIDDFPDIAPPAAPNRDPFHIYDEPPVPEYLASPVYPQLSLEAGIEGTVLVKVFVGLDHRVHQAVVVSSDVTPEMEAAAIEAALKSRFKPAKQQSIEVEVWVAIPIIFTLN